MPADKMTVQIYTISGRMIWREEVNANAGFVMIPWEGRDSDGKKVSNGVYYCKINSTVGEKVESEIIKIMKLEWSSSEALPSHFSCKSSIIVLSSVDFVTTNSDQP